jgi:hypothetical protein
MFYARSFAVCPAFPSGLPCLIDGTGVYEEKLDPVNVRSTTEYALAARDIDVWTNVS